MKAKVGVSIHPDFQGRGFGTKLLGADAEAAITHGFERLEAHTPVGNVAMRRILEKSGIELGRPRKTGAKINKNCYEEDCYVPSLSR